MIDGISSLISSFGVVYNAYCSVKSNRARCAQLKDRCEMIMMRAKEMIEQHQQNSGPQPGTDQRRGVVLERLEDLDKTFRKTAETICLVGQQSWVTSLLRTQENAAAITDAQHALTELISILNVSAVFNAPVAFADD